MLLALVLAQLSAGHAHVRLIDGDADQPKPLEQMTREELQREWLRLDAGEPSFGGSIAMAAGGAAMAIGGILCCVYGAVFALVNSVGVDVIPSWGAPALLIAGIVLLAGGITLAVFGGLGIRDAVYERRERKRQLEKIRDLLEGAPPMPFDRQAVPPPPPTSVQNLPPAPVGRVVVASW